MSEEALPLHVETTGRDPGWDVETFVLLHGYGASLFSWRHWTPQLARRGHVILVDLKGFGSAPDPDDDHYGPADQAHLVVRMIRERALDNLTFIGHSLGGAVTLLAALSLQDLGPVEAKRLVIVGGVAYQQRTPPFVRLARYPRVGAALMRLAGPERVVRHVLRSVVHDPAAIRPSIVRGYAAPLEARESLTGLIKAARQIVPENLDDVVARYPLLDLPALLIWGRHDRVVPLWVGERLASALPDAQLEVIDACGHLPAEEAPAESWARVESFLDAHPV